MRRHTTTVVGQNIVSLRLAIMITTHNRLSELQRTASVLSNLEPPPDEVLITADGCNDGTEYWIRENLPDARLIVNHPGAGSIPSRDRMLRESNCDFVLSLDDDSYPIEADAIKRLKDWFEVHDGVGVATFPLVTEEYPETLSTKEFEGQGYSATFPNCAACFVTDVYRQQPGFPLHFFHIYEEPDYGLQCIAAGFAVVHTNVITVRHHWTSLGRNELKVHHSQARNELWSTLMRAPFPWAIGIIIYRIFSQFRYACSRGVDWAIREPIWWWRAMRRIPTCLQHRHSVSWKKYRAWITLLRQPTTDQGQWQQLTNSKDQLMEDAKCPSADEQSNKRCLIE